MTICQSMAKGMLGRLLFVVEWDYGTYGTYGTYGYGTMGQWDGCCMGRMGRVAWDYGTASCPCSKTAASFLF
jgi:hypothetical protein